MTSGLDWLDGRVARLAALRRQAGPALEADEAEAAPKSVRTGQELLLHLVYRGASGDESERTVLVREVFRSGGVIFLGGHCHLRNMTRQFRSDRIVTLANGRTGEVIEDVTGFLDSIAPELEKGHANMGWREDRAAQLPEGTVARWTAAQRQMLRDASRPFAILMMALAKADGDWHPKELTALDAMVRERREWLCLPDAISGRVLMVAEYSAIVPSNNLVTRACRAILAGREAFADAPLWCRRMIEADGRTHPDEVHEYRAIVARLAELADE